MARIKIVEFLTAAPEAREEYDKQIKLHGRITNMKKTLLNNVPSFKVLMEWYPLRDEVCKIVGEYAVNVYAHAISSANNCLVCSTFFRKILKDFGKNPDNLEWDETTKLLADYGKACVMQPVKVENELFERMKARFSDSEIVLLTAFAGMMIATNLINNALEVELDDYLESYTKR